MTVQEQRAYVERRYADVYAIRKAGFLPTPEMTKQQMIEAAYAFTVARERDIAEREEEIGFVTYYLEETEHAVWKRILVRLTALLEEKRKGWKL